MYLQTQSYRSIANRIRIELFNHDCIVFIYIQISLVCVMHFTMIFMIISVKFESKIKYTTPSSIAKSPLRPPLITIHRDHRDDERDVPNEISRRSNMVSRSLLSLSPRRQCTLSRC